jgi:hypothetical protein
MKSHTEIESATGCRMPHISILKCGFKFARSANPYLNGRVPSCPVGGPVNGVSNSGRKFSFKRPSTP